MVADTGRLRKNGFAFGPFRLYPVERLLEKDGVPVHIGGRALDILICLAERAGDVVSKRDLVATVWADVTVDEGSLRFHVGALRKALGDGQDGARFITNVPGRGYCLVAAVSREGGMVPERPVERPPASPQSPPVQSPPARSLPPRLGRIVGRDEATREIADALSAHRFVTIVGPGGIGKTTVAVAVAHRLAEGFDGEAHFIDLGQIGDPKLVASAVASALGLVVSTADPVPSILASFKDKRLLLLFDSCEHVVESVAQVTETIFAAAPQVHILATSREALRVEGEQVYRLVPLDCPPHTADLTAAEALRFPAAQLFVERIAATIGPYELADGEAPVVAEICLKLDGIALAIELAAGGVQAYGLQGIAELLNHRFGLLWQGRRTARPRHQTLAAMLDWSYNLLTPAEALVLCRLSAFVGPFSLEAAQAVAAGSGIEWLQVIEALASLVAKSLVSTERVGPAMQYRLLDTTRGYAFGKLSQSGESLEIRRRHAVYFSALLQALDAETVASGDRRAPHRDQLGNIRAALEWSFSDEGDPQVAVPLAATAALFFLELSLLTECHRWTARALAALDERSTGTRLEMALQSSLGVSLMFTLGNRDEVGAAFRRGLELAETFDDRHCQLRLLRNFHLYLTRAGDFRGSLEIGRRSIEVAHGFDNADDTLMAEWMLGVAHHLIGNQREAVAYCESAMTRPGTLRRNNLVHLGYDHRMIALVAYARALWLRGSPDQAIQVARHTLKEAEALDHPVTLCISMIWATFVFLWSGDWDSAEEIIERLLHHATEQSFGPYHAVGLGLKGELAIEQGEPARGVALLQNCLEALRAGRHQILITVFEASQATGLAQLGRWSEARATIDGALACVGLDGETFDLPEILRVRAGILVASPDPDLAAAEEALGQALDRARRQAALGWALRSATALAALRRQQGRREEALALLAPIVAEFAPEARSADLTRARALLQELEEPDAR
ncbi:transcriptional regulator [Aliidongia dinghuensis]|uniref:Transcriptional regulator n=1 Tax=Aliidongia dinghuensis TaxID=1867774 RepID=A0A8J2YY43_9PROT|nr:winged helix-turn-helix domain-containing protein [Aliidongia dinghuensis]GGF39533.1 transcriptional regulator [Aliidongia dinghuensis]